MTFDFGEDAVGYFGAAVSYDLLSWHWSDSERFRAEEKERFSFTYTFSAEENEVYFAHNMLYNLEKFKMLDFIKQSVLCIDSDATPCPMGEFGSGDRLILLTARHHACEAPANYVLEGVLKELYSDMPDGYRVIVVPFVDTAGVVAGDQGKKRLPHDHNRDYISDSLYPTVRAMKRLLNTYNVNYVFDFHSPCHLGGGNDRMSLVNAYERFRNKMERFSSLFISEINDECFVYTGAVTWRDTPLEGTFSAYVGGLENTEFAATLEAPYFGTSDNMMTAERYLATGNAFGRAIRRFL